MTAPRSHRSIGVAFALLTADLLLARPGEALLIAGPDIIAPPPNVINNPPGATNTHQQGFNEQQSVLLLAPLAVDSGVIAAGTLVNSHMILMNVLSGSASDDRIWTFDGIVLGVMSDVGGTLEAASTALLGAAGTIYPAAFSNRGLETNDFSIVAANTLRSHDSVTQPGDWIRVITLASNRVPEPATLLLVALGALALATRRRRG